MGKHAQESYVSGAINALDTDDIEEGSSNLYFTNQRALNATAATIASASAAAILSASAYTDSQISAVIGAAPGALDTLNELAAALNDDASFSTTVTNSLAEKAPLASPTFTGTVIFSETPTVGAYGGPGATITVDGTVITQIRDTYAFAAGGNALQFYYASLPVNASHLAAAQAVINGTEITVFDGTSTYTFTATGAGFETSMGGNLIVIPGTGNGSGYYSTGAYAIIPEGSAVPIATTDDVVLKTGGSFTGNVNVVSPTDDGSNGVRQITVSTSSPTGGSDGDVWLVYAP